MNTATWSSTTIPAAGSYEVLLSLGFAPAAGGYVRDGLSICPGKDWWTFVHETSHGGSQDAKPFDPLSLAGAPGLWKWLDHSGSIGGRRKCLVLPASIFSQNIDETLWDDPGLSAAEAIIQWVQETAAGRVPPGWRAPERTVVESWFDRAQLTVVAGTALRQGELLWEPERFALRFPILPQVPEGLPPSRLAWLRVLLEETQNRWQFVRCGFAPDAEGNGSIALAEVDLTGVPPVVNETLFVPALEALRFAVQWLGEPADWLADAEVVSELLAVCPK